jgi:hypothetical protein
VNALREELERSDLLRAELARLETIRSLLITTAHDSADASLKPFFADRTMRRLQPVRNPASTEDELASLLIRFFRPIAIASLLLAICLAVYNINVSNDFAAETTTTEAILALPPVSSMSIYELDVFTSESLTQP